MATADGRNVKKPAVAQTVTASHVTFRIDDDDPANSTFWADLRLSRTELRAILKQMDKVAAGETALKQ